MAGNHNEIEKKLWEAADQLRANSKLKSSEYSIPVLGLIFLRYADHKFSVLDAEFKKGKVESDSRVGITKTDYQARGVLYLPENSRFSYLLNLPEDENMGKAINEAMKAIETENEDLKDVLPKTTHVLTTMFLSPLSRTSQASPWTQKGMYLERFMSISSGNSPWRKGNVVASSLPLLPLSS